MARSRRSTPCCGITTSESEKSEKQNNNRRLRRKVKTVIESNDLECIPEIREVSNEWSMSKDGRKRFDPEKFPELLRK